MGRFECGRLMAPYLDRGYALVPHVSGTDQHGDELRDVASSTPSSAMREREICCGALVCLVLAAALIWARR